MAELRFAWSASRWGFAYGMELGFWGGGIVCGGVSRLGKRWLLVAWEWWDKDGECKSGLGGLEG